jgi:hypothetical protein
MVEYFHIFDEDNELVYVGLALSTAVKVMNILKKHNKKPVIKSYLLDPVALESLSESYDNNK